MLILSEIMSIPFTEGIKSESTKAMFRKEEHFNLRGYKIAIM